MNSDLSDFSAALMLIFERRFMLDTVQSDKRS